MLKMYRYECEPNNPVIPKAFVLFTIRRDDDRDPMVLGMVLAEECGCYNFMEDATLTLIADVSYVHHVYKSFMDCVIVDYVTGEY